MTFDEAAAQGYVLLTNDSWRRSVVSDLGLTGHLILTDSGSTMLPHWCWAFCNVVSSVGSYREHAKWHALALRLKQDEDLRLAFDTYYRLGGTERDHYLWLLEQTKLLAPEL